jgi:amino acid permease
MASSSSSSSSPSSDSISDPSSSSGNHQQQHSRRDDDDANEHVNDLNVWNGSALLVADCMGTGLLALPNDIKVLGPTFGMLFLIANLPINWFAGNILSLAADRVERGGQQQQQQMTTIATATVTAITSGLLQEDNSTSISNRTENNNYLAIRNTSDDVAYDEDADAEKIDERNENIDAATFDFVGMTMAIFDNPQTTRLVMILYYVNIFLVLGNYIVVMSHAVVALLADEKDNKGILSCTPVAGLLASTLMFAVSQLRTMAKLGRRASTLSLLALAVVVAQCLYFSSDSTTTPSDDITTKNVDDVDDDGGGDDDENADVGFRLVLRQLSALGSIGFATGSQKLFLNIRHEFADRKDAPKSLAVSLSAFGSVYIFIILMAGDNPPSFLFDAIPIGTIHRRVAGFFLWAHVVVSYAINSQAICSSCDRVFFSQWEPVRRWSDERRWMALTAIIALTAFLIANAVPFFKDLVAFIGALTAVPLTLLMPAIFYRRACENVPVWFPALTWNSITTTTRKTISGSYALLIYASIFTVLSTLGSVYSILDDWEHHTGGFFSCH